jgi:hypothetical protein
MSQSCQGTTVITFEIFISKKKNIPEDSLFSFTISFQKSFCEKLNISETNIISIEAGKAVG